MQREPVGSARISLPFITKACRKRPASRLRLMHMMAVNGYTSIESRSLGLAHTTGMVRHATDDKVREVCGVLRSGDLHRRAPRCNCISSDCIDTFQRGVGSPREPQAFPSLDATYG